MLAGELELGVVPAPFSPVVVWGTAPVDPLIFGAVLLLLLATRTPAGADELAAGPELAWELLLLELFEVWVPVPFSPLPQPDSANTGTRRVIINVTGKSILRLSISSPSLLKMGLLGFVWANLS